MNAGAQLWKELCAVQTLPRKVSSTSLSLLQGGPRPSSPASTTADFPAAVCMQQVLGISFPGVNLVQLLQGRQAVETKPP